MMTIGKFCLPLADSYLNYNLPWGTTFTTEGILVADITKELPNLRLEVKMLNTPYRLNIVLIYQWVWHLSVHIYG